MASSSFTDPSNDPKEKIKHYFNALRADNLEILDGFYAQEMRFEDPLGSIDGLPAMKDYYAKMYQNVTDIRFDFEKIVGEGEEFMATWTMTLEAKGLNSGEPVSSKGVSHLRFDPSSGLVVYHRDYFDMYEFIYQHIPFVGYVTRKVNERLAH